MYGFSIYLQFSLKSLSYAGRVGHAKMSCWNCMLVETSNVNCGECLTLFVFVFCFLFFLYSLFFFPKKEREVMKFSFIGITISKQLAHSTS